MRGIPYYNELLGLNTVPLHELAWKEERLDLGSGDCYPMVDVLERIAEVLTAPPIVQRHIVENYKKIEVVDQEVFICECGFEAKNKAGLTAHQRKCKGGDEK